MDSCTIAKRDEVTKCFMTLKNYPIIDEKKIYWNRT